MTAIQRLLRSLRGWMLGWSAWVCLASESAAVTIHLEVGPLRSSEGDALVNQRTMYVVVLDEDGDGLLPGSLRRDQSLQAGAMAAVHQAFAGKILAAGTLLGGDRVLKAGFLEDEDGIGFPVITLQDFADSGLAVESDRIYGYYWFPGHAGGALPEGDFEVGGICELSLYAQAGAVPTGMKVPELGSVVVTSVLDAQWGGNLTDSSRFTAIKAAAPIEPPQIIGVMVDGADIVIAVSRADGLLCQLETSSRPDGEWIVVGAERVGQDLPFFMRHPEGFDGAKRFYRLRWNVK